MMQNGFDIPDWLLSVVVYTFVSLVSERSPVGLWKETQMLLGDGGEKICQINLLPLQKIWMYLSVEKSWRISEADSPRLQGKLEAWQRWSPYTERPRPPLWSAPAGHHGNRWDTSLQELRETHFINSVTDNFLKDKAAYTRRNSGSRQRNRTRLQFFWLMEKSASNFPLATKHPLIKHELKRKTEITEQN